LSFRKILALVPTGASTLNTTYVGFFTSEDKKKVKQKVSILEV